MNPEQVRLWIAEGESLCLEFKGEEHRPLSDRELVEEAVCMANRPVARDAFILVRVEDDGRITGAPPRHESGTIQWLDNQIEISNPGGFPEGVHLGNLLVTPPRPRNPLLADALKRAGLVERTARGIDTIFYEQLRNGRPAPSYERSTETDVVLVLPGGSANLRFVQLVQEENKAGRLLSLDELLILNRLWQERHLNLREAAYLIQKPEADARAVLEHLVEAGLAEARGERKGRTYHLSSATYRRLGERVAYIRRRGFEDIQMEQMILQFVKTYARITRREAADLCKLSPPQAYRLLQRLVSKGELVRHGAKRGAWYGPRA